MAINSRNKGKAGELEAARLLREYGYDARRGQQYSGANGDADVTGLPGIHIEVKRNEHLNIFDAVNQSVKDARPGELPIVMHRKNRTPWLITMKFEDFISIYEGLESGGKKDDR